MCRDQQAKPAKLAQPAKQKKGREKKTTVNRLSKFLFYLIVIQNEN